MNRVQPSPSGSALPFSCSRGFAGTVPSEWNAVQRFLQLQAEATPASLTPHVWVFCWGWAGSRNFHLLTSSLTLACYSLTAQKQPLWRLKGGEGE